MENNNDVYRESVPFIGDPFPKLMVETTRGNLTLPDHFSGQWFILFSHPGDFTPVCTTEFMAFEALRSEFTNRNTQLIGISIDQVQAHMKWLEWIQEKFEIEIKFPVIADGLGRTARRLGLIHPERGTKTVRSVFIVDPEGTIRLMMTYPDNVGRNLHEIIRALTALQVADAEKAATPANWPNNPWLKDQLIVPPPKTIQEINQQIEKAQAGEITCYDWWFCSKYLK